MRRPPPPIADLTMRAATVDDADELGLVMVAASLSAFLGAMPEEDIDWSWTPEVSAANWRAFLDQAWPDGEFFDVAVRAGRVLGFVLAGRSTGRDDYRRAVDGLYLRPSAQGLGIGRAMLAHAAERVAAAGDDSLLVGCAAINPSCGFYRHLGGIEVARAPLRVDGTETEEVFFGWSTLAPLRRRP
jgi:GNAT superfamily N-acetyltransferase